MGAYDLTQFIESIWGNYVAFVKSRPCLPYVPSKSAGLTNSKWFSQSGSVAVGLPVIMGANIDTSITNTLVSLGHMGSKKEFRQAFAVASVHDFFSLLSVVIFLPLEIAFGLLKSSQRSQRNARALLWATYSACFSWHRVC